MNEMRNDLKEHYIFDFNQFKLCQKSRENAMRFHGLFFLQGAPIVREPL